MSFVFHLQTRGGHAAQRAAYRMHMLYVLWAGNCIKIERLEDGYDLYIYICVVVTIRKTCNLENWSRWFTLFLNTCVDPRARRPKGPLTA